MDPMSDYYSKQAGNTVLFLPTLRLAIRAQQINGLNYTRLNASLGVDEVTSNVIALFLNPP